MVVISTGIRNFSGDVNNIRITFKQGNTSFSTILTIQEFKELKLEVNNIKLNKLDIWG